MSSHARPVRPDYHPCDLLKLYIYGYLNRVQSSRRLERKAGRNVEVMWLTGRLASGHKTIADFRMDNGLVMDVSRHEHWSDRTGKPCFWEGG
jgi:transposase